MKKIIFVLFAIMFCCPIFANDVSEIVGKYYCSNVTQKGESGIPASLTVIEIRKEEFCTIYPSYSVKKCEYVWDEKDERYYIYKTSDKDRKKEKASFVEVATQLEGQLPSQLKIVFHGENDEPEYFDRVKDINEARKLFQELNFDIEYGQPPQDADYAIMEYIKRKSWWPDIEVINISGVQKIAGYGYKVRIEFIPIGKYLNKLNKTCYDFYFQAGSISTFKKIY